MISSPPTVEIQRNMEGTNTSNMLSPDLTCHRSDFFNTHA
jgi:hypothetical protein